MTYKYAVELSTIPECPPKSISPRRGKFFRVLHSTSNNPNNFIPPAKINPTRGFKDDKQRCDGWALSMFESEQQIEAFFVDITTKYRNFAKTSGGYLGAVDVVESDGSATTTDGKGHFSLHETAGVDWSHKHKIIKQFPVK